MPNHDCCALVDLRQYTLHPGQRDTLIDVFDRHFVEGQEETGMHIVGQFRDLDDPDRFVWLRGFPDLPTREQSLHDFYYGPVWKAHNREANATMVDSANALLLRPVNLRDGYPTRDAPRAPIGSTETPTTMISATVFHRRSPDDDFAEFFRTRIEPLLLDAGVTPVASFATMPAANNFPQLPLRPDPVFAWFGRFPNYQAYADHRRALAVSPHWHRTVAAELRNRTTRPAQELRLSPTTRSQFGH